jgi:hypothetical protein
MVGEALVEDANLINEDVELAREAEDLLALYHEVEGHMQGHESGDSRVAKRIAHEKLLALPLREVRLPNERLLQEILPWEDHTDAAYDYLYLFLHFFLVFLLGVGHF